ncbi:MAG: GDP-mannose 4,6-dehydratase [Saprospiraceae bacterium]|nr:GDP-mannose 4,6-dehydratase [Saprospiraceae bacterium]
MKKILITGVAGFLGSNLLRKMLHEGHAVVGIDNLSMGKLDNILPYMNDSNFTFLQKDIVETSTFQELDADFDAIVHLAAFKIPRYGKTLDTLQINGKGAENVLNFAREFSIKCVLASTSDVYGMSTDLPFKEDGNCLIGDSKAPRWAYAVSKLYDEHLALAYMEAYNFPVVLLRFFGSYGPNQHLSWWGGPQSVFIEKIFKDEVIPIHGDGQQTRTFTYVEDTITGIYLATMKDEANGEVFNIGAGGEQEITILDLAKLLKRLSGTPGELKYELIPYDQISKGRKYQDVMRRVPDTTKSEKILGFKAKVGVEEGMLKAIEWQRQFIEINVEK